MILNTQRNASPTMARSRAIVMMSGAAVIGLITWCTGPRLALAEAPNATVESTDTEAISAADANLSAARQIVQEDVPVSAQRSVSVAWEAESAPELVLQNTQVARDSSAPVTATVRTISHAAAVHGPAPSEEGMTVPSRDSNSVPSSRTTLERRIERLEDLIESMLSEEGFERLKDEPKSADNSRRELTDKEREFERVQEQLEAMVDLNLELPDLHVRVPHLAELKGLEEEEIARISADTRRQVERAVREASRYAQAHDQYRRQAAEEVARRYDRQHALKSSLERERAALDAQYRALEMQIESISRQLRRLEEQRDELEDRIEEFEHDSSGKRESMESLPEAPPPPAAPAPVQP